MSKIYSTLATVALLFSMPGLAANLAELSLAPKEPSQGQDGSKDSTKQTADKVIKENKQIEKAPPTCDGDY